MSIPSIPRIVLAASFSAWCAASLHDSEDTPTRSIVLMTAIPSPFYRPSYTSMNRR